MLHVDGSVNDYFESVALQDQLAAWLPVSFISQGYPRFRGRKFHKKSQKHT